MLQGHRRERGFTLLEVIVTMAVLSLSLTVLYQVYSSVARNTGVSADYLTALQIAETKMALLAAGTSSTSGSSGVLNEHFRWQSRVKSYTPPNDSPLSGDVFESALEHGQQPYLLSVRVTWGERTTRSVELNTVRMESDR